MGGLKSTILCCAMGGIDLTGLARDMDSGKRDREGLELLVWVGGWSAFDMAFLFPLYVLVRFI
jgi:hypothetical protein